MAWKSTILKPYAAYLSRQVEKMSNNAIISQERLLAELISKSSKTAFAKDHNFKNIKNYDDFKTQVPIRSYEEMYPYVCRVLSGEKDILWRDKPKYIIGTSGTTSGIKYVPVSHDSIGYHFKTARNATFHFCYTHNLMSMYDGKLLFLSGSPLLSDLNGFPTGRLSGIVNHEIPAWLRKSKLPSFDINCMADWNEKIKAMATESIKCDLRMISGITPWIMMFMEKVIALSGRKDLLSVFPNLQLIVHGGVSFEPYKKRIFELVGKEIPTLETYPSTEGFIAFKSNISGTDLLLNTNGGIYYEFVKLSDFYARKIHNRCNLSEVVKEEEYVIILTTNAGLWASLIGDIVEFTSLAPYKIRFRGRTEHFLSAFGEHVISAQVENALVETIKTSTAVVTEFCVAPMVADNKNKSYHEWFIEFDRMPQNLSIFEKELDNEMQKQNFHYQDLIEGKVISPLKINILKQGAFRTYMDNIGKLGGQNKIPHLSNNRIMADALSDYTIGKYAL